MSVMVCSALLLPSALGADELPAWVLGWPSVDFGTDVIETNDGGFLVSGAKYSAAAGGYDAVLMKFDANWTYQWTRVVGGGANEQGYQLLELPGGNVIQTSYTGSFGAGGHDVYAIKYGPTGTFVSSWTVGGAQDEFAFDVDRLLDGGLVFCGRTRSFGAGLSDLMVSKFSPTGAHAWTVTIGDTGWDWGNSVAASSNGDCWIVGSVEGLGPGGTDVLVTRLGATGVHVMSFTLGGAGEDKGSCIIETQDHGIAVTGYTLSSGQGGTDIFVSRFDSVGTHLWSRTVGGTGYETGRSIVETADGGFLIVGHRNYYGSFWHDVVVSRFDGMGNHLWTRIIDGGGDEQGWDAVEYSDGEYAVVGESDSLGGAGDQEFLLSLFDELGHNCAAEVFGVVVSPWSPTHTDVDPVVEYQTPTVTYPDPQVLSVDPALTLVCPLCGDANNDYSVTAADGYMILNYFGAGPEPHTCWRANVNGDGNLTTADGYHLLNYLGAGPALVCANCEL
jgi:hypothetical protein